MIGILKRTRGLVLAMLLAGAALALFAVAASSSGAATATETQNLQAEISSEVSWGTAGSCAQNIQTNNFGALTPNPTAATLGSFDALPSASASTDSGGNHVWVGCVTSNVTLASVTGAGTADMSSGANSLPLSNVAIGLTNSPVGGNCNVTANQSGAGSCTLPNDGATSQTLLAGAPAGTNELDWQYQLNLPANQPVGSYTGGQVTFTATA
jgi:hypothetical protein